jgi:hypothetical protein
MFYFSQHDLLFLYQANLFEEIIQQVSYRKITASKTCQESGHRPCDILQWECQQQ